MQQVHSISCRCETVSLTLTGPHIMSSECMCTSCRTASEVLAVLPGGVSLADNKGATHVIIHRVDRVTCTTGSECLKAHRLTAESPTKRVVASCCNTPMFLDFEPGHWLSLYAINWQKQQLPAVQYRMFCNDLPDANQLPTDVPNGKPMPLGAVWRLASTAARMGFRRPKVTFVKGSLNA